MTKLVSFLACFLIIWTSYLFADKSGFQQVFPGRIFNFPLDHGKHSEFQTEWWYFTGNLDSDAGRKFGFQLTFFRHALTKMPVRSSSAWSVGDLYPAHFALSDITNEKFFSKEIISREGPGLAKASGDDLLIQVKNWSAKRDRNDKIDLFAHESNYSLSLRLTPLKPLVLHGDKGYSAKSERQGQASYYYSFTRMAAFGKLTFEGHDYTVSGLAWMDHEFGSSVLFKDQAGWDWFSLQLNDGTEIMISQIRRKDGSYERPFGTLIDKGGNAEDLVNQNILISSKNSWTSPKSGAVYPSEWKIEIPDKGIVLNIKPSFQNQELSSGESTGVIYWEGAVAVQGFKPGKKIDGRGYVELTGYAKPVGGLF